MNLMISLWAFSPLAASPTTLSDSMISKVAQDSRLHTASCQAFAAHAAELRGEWDGDSSRPVPAEQRMTALDLLFSYPGLSAAESAVYGHILRDPNMDVEMQEQLSGLLGTGCPIVAYFDLASGLLAGLRLEGGNPPLAGAVRYAIVANALRDAQRQPHLVALLVHSVLLEQLERQGWLKHEQAAAQVAHIRQVAAEVRAQAHSAGQGVDLRTQLEQAEPLRQAMLGFLLGEAALGS